MVRWNWWQRRKAAVVTNPWEDFAREEARLWIWMATATTLALTAFGLSAIPFPAAAPFAAMHMRYDEVAPALLLLLLLFNTQMLRRRWAIRRGRKNLTAAKQASAALDAIPEAAGIDDVTGLGNRKAAEVQLGREMAFARRCGEPLSLLMIGLDDFAGVRGRIGKEMSEQLLRDFAQQLRRATRGSDFLVRFADDEFLAILPRCAMGDVPRIVHRLGPLTVEFHGGELTVEYSTGWLDPQPGETPDGPLKRAHEMLKLYKNVESAKDTVAPAGMR